MLSTSSEPVSAGYDASVKGEAAKCYLQYYKPFVIIVYSAKFKCYKYYWYVLL